MRSLGMKLFLVLIATLAVCAGILYGGIRLGNYMIDTYYLSDAQIEKRNERLRSEFREYVEKNQVDASDADAIGAWTDKERYVYMIVFRDNKTPILEADSGGGASTIPSEDAEYYLDETLYPVMFVDGQHYISMYEYSEFFWYNAITIGMTVISGALFLLSLLLYNRRVVRRIVQLERDTDWIGKGNLNGVISVCGKDEIGRLAGEISDMRDSVIRQMRDEQAVWTANSQLITSISHDIRTPLTSLIGYLDLLNTHQYDNEEQLLEYAAASQQKAMQLKELTDELFRYFLVFGQKNIDLSIREYDASVIMEQMLGEQVFSLREKGYTVEMETLNGSFFVRVDAMYLKRVFDNLFSNILKYADSSAPVKVTALQKDGELMIRVENAIAARPSKAESTNIGLKTCWKIIDQMKGRFKIVKNGTCFTAEILLPLCPTPRLPQTE